MMQLLRHLKDFLVNDEQMRWLPGNINAGNFILLTEHSSKKTKEMRDGKEMTVISDSKTVVHVFDHAGIFIGTIEKPEWIPKA